MKRHAEATLAGAGERMPAATHPPDRREDVRLLIVDGERRSLSDRSFASFADALAPGDLVVVNDAATLPASLHGSIEPFGNPIELRLLGPLAEARDSDWRGVLFGAGDWRIDTDLRPAPPRLEPGTTLRFGTLRAELLARSSISPRLLELRFDREGAALWHALYRQGRPIQYSHLDAPLELWSVQTLFAGRPWAIEMPSAGRPLTAASLVELRRRGIGLARLTHAAGLSASGDPRIDAALPLPERYEIPQASVDAIAETRARGGRVIAVGTTVVRALESAARGGELRAGAGVAELIVDADHRLQIVDALLTGMHGPGESHYRLLRAFADEPLLAEAWQRARAAGYRSHEFGDAALLLPRRIGVARRLGARQLQ
ncbi:S-adenosylmethionine:tRNA ribosyltransferase-isomerase [Nannocystaceae bacterium ST9]